MKETKQDFNSLFSIEFYSVMRAKVRPFRQHIHIYTLLLDGRVTGSTVLPFKVDFKMELEFENVYPPSICVKRGHFPEGQDKVIL